MADKNISKTLETDLDLHIHWVATNMNWAEAYDAASKYLRRHVIRCWLSVTEFEFSGCHTAFIVNIAILIYLGLIAIYKGSNNQEDWVYFALGSVGMFVMLFGLFYMPGIFRIKRVTKKIESDRDYYEALCQEQVKNIERLSVELGLQPAHSLAKAQEIKENLGKFKYVLFIPSGRYRGNKYELDDITLYACFENQKKHLTKLAP